MSKVKPNTKEQTIDYLIRYLSLGTYDKKFLTNLLQLNVAQRKPVTTNQAELLDKILVRYHRQLAKKEIDSKELINLLWTLPPIESSPQYTQAHVSLEGDEIILRTPYKKEFVKQIKEIQYLKWNRDDKLWSAPKAEFILKKIINLTDEHFNNVNFCSEIKTIIDNLYVYETAKFWNPTLTRINGNLYIVAANAEVMDAISFITLDTTPSTLARLTRMGIIIDPELVDESMNDVISGDVTIDNFSIETIINFLLLIKADLVVLTEWFMKNKDFVMELANNLKANNIKVKVLRGKILTTDKEQYVDYRKYEMPVNINVGMLKYNHDSVPFLAKNIFLANSTTTKNFINERM